MIPLLLAGARWLALLGLGLAGSVALRLSADDVTGLSAEDVTGAFGSSALTS